MLNVELWNKYYIMKKSSSFQDYANMDDFSLDLDNVTENMFDHFKVNLKLDLGIPFILATIIKREKLFQCTILNETWRFLYPHIANLPPEVRLHSLYSYHVGLESNEEKYITHISQTKKAASCLISENNVYLKH